MDKDELSGLEDLRLLVDEIATLESSSESDAHETRLRLSLELTVAADQQLHDSVAAARDAGLSWQRIGEVLEISRQAAFQRFKASTDTERNNAMPTRAHEALIERAEAVYWQLEAGDFDIVANDMTFVVQRILTKDKVMKVWHGARTMIGSLESLGESTSRPTRRNAQVVETPLQFEAGDLVGRIAFNKRQKIVGMLVMSPDDLADAPF